MFDRRQVAEVQPPLHFGSFSIGIRYLEHECVLVPSFSMSLYQVSGDAAGCATNLIGERVDLMFRENCGFPKNIESKTVCYLKYLKVAVSRHYLPPAACILPPVARVLPP